MKTYSLSRWFVFSAISAVISFIPLKWGYPVLAQSVTPAADGTGTIVDQMGNQFNIHGGTQAGANLFHSLQQFGLNEAEIANFLSNPQIQNILTRVVGGDPSVIHGLIQVMGGHSNLFIMNPAGVIFGENATLNVPADFVVTTANGIGFGGDRWFNAEGNNDYANLVGNPSEFAFDLANAGSIINSGNLSVAQGQNLTLIGGNVINTGILSAPSGNITLAAIKDAGLVRISAPNHLVSLAIEPPRTSAGQVATVRPVDLATLLTVGAKGLTTGITVDSQGNPAFNGISLPNSHGNTIVSGNVTTNGNQGGNITAVGTNVGVMEGTVSASGNNGGGTIRIGGDYQGGNALYAAENTLISQDSRIAADALQQGHGGRVIVWAENHTQFNGEITARGGIHGGNGGFVETSGKNGLNAIGNVDARAFQGQAGEWLLDPTNIIIRNATSERGGFTGGNPNTFIPTANDAIADRNTIQTSLNNGTSVTVTTASSGTQPGNIQVLDSITVTALVGSNPTLTLRADGDLLVNNNITATGGSLNLNLFANENNDGNGQVVIRPQSLTNPANRVTINTNGGNLVARNFTDPAQVVSSEFNGILLQQATINTGSGNITLSGKADNSGAIRAAGGVSLEQTTLNTNGGTIQLTGLVTGNALQASGVFITGSTVNPSTVTAGGNGNVSLEGRGSTSNVNGLAFGIDIGATIQATGIGNVSLTADRMNWANSTRIRGNNNLTIQPLTPNRNIALGVANNSDSNRLNITTAQLGQIQNGFTSLTVGRDNGSGVLTVSSPLARNEALTLRSPAGSVVIANPINNNGAVTVQSNNTQLNQPITTQNQNITLLGNTILGQDITLNTGAGAGNITFNGSLSGNHDLIANGGMGNVVFLGTVNIQDLTVNSSSITQFNGNINAASLTTNAGGSTELIGNLTTTGNQSYNDPVSLIGNATLTAANLTLAQALNGNNNDLTLNITNPVTVSNPIISNIRNFTSQGAGGTVINGNFTTTGTQTYNNAVNLVADAQLTGTDVIFNNTLSGNQALTVNSNGVTRFNDSVNVNSLTTDAAGNTEINGGSVTTIGAQIYNDSVSLGADTQLNGTDVTFNNTLSGNQALTVNSNGVTRFNDSVNVNSVTTDAPGSTEINGGSVTTTGAQTYNDSVSLGADTQLNGTDITFNNTLSGNQALTVNSNGVTRFNDSVNVNSVTTDAAGSTEINGGSVTTTGAQTYNDSVSLGADTQLNGTDVTFNNTLSGNQALTVNSNGVTRFNDSVNVNSLTTDAAGNTEINGGSVTTTGAQIYNDSVIIGNATTLTGSNLTFNQTLNSENGENNNLSLNPRLGNVTLNGEVGNTQPLGNFNIAQANTITSNNIRANSLNFNANNQIQTRDLEANAIALRSNNSTITTGILDTSGTQGGNITLNAPQDITITQINAQGTNGSGGMVDITTQRFFRANSAFLDQTGRNSSISSAGTTGGGSINIRHGGNGMIPFTVGDASLNGTAGAINSGNFTIANGSFLFTTRVGNIAIISVDAPIPPDPTPPTPTPPTPTPPTPTPPTPTPPTPTPPTPTPDPEFPDIPDDNPTLIPPDPSVNNPSFPNNQNLSLNNSGVSPIAIRSIQEIEGQLNREFESFLGIDPVEPLTLDEVQSLLRRLELETTVRSAIIYLFFRPNPEGNLQWTFNANNADVVRPPEERGEDILEIVLVTGEGPVIRRQVEISRNDALSVVSQLQSTITNPRRPTAYLSSSQQLYQWMLSPLESDLEERNIKNLVFILDSGLRSVPIAALHDGKGFVVERYSLSVMPTVSLTDPTYTNLKDQQVLAMGVSQFELQNPLPAVPVELSLITGQIWQGQSFLNQDFTIEQLQQARQSGNFPILHIATHANFESGALQNSYIQLWDEQLLLSQLRNLDLNDPAVSLLILSACRTALGDANSELGFAGAAVLAKVNTVLGSLWEVSDEGTLALMTSFYEALQTAPIKSEALREAQLTLLRGEARIRDGQLILGTQQIPLPPQLQDIDNQTLTHPYYWSAFTMIGSPW